MVRVPLWIAIGIVILGLIGVVSGEAAFGTQEKCEEWIEDKAVESILAGEEPPNGYQFIGLGIGFCVAN